MFVFVLAVRVYVWACFRIFFLFVCVLFCWLLLLSHIFAFVMSSCRFNVFYVFAFMFYYLYLFYCICFTFVYDALFWLCLYFLFVSYLWLWFWGAEQVWKWEGIILLRVVGCPLPPAGEYIYVKLFDIIRYDQMEWIGVKEKGPWL